MTEREWLACEEISHLLVFHRETASPRKLRLLACASCRRLWKVLKNPADREAVEVAEQYADRAIPDARRAEARRQTTPVLALRQRLGNPHSPAHYAVGRTRDVANEIWYCLNGARNAASIAETLRTGEFGTAHHDEEVAHCALAREIFGNPFRPVQFDPSWRTAAASRAARAAYEKRKLPPGHLDPARLAALADALEEAGCTEGTILSHLRSPGTHVRGCRALDTVLGKR
jgi:hypothetical protein